MLPQRHEQCCKNASLSAILIVACALAGLPAAAQEDDLPDAAGIARAYNSAREWITGYKVPREEDEGVSIPIENATAAYILLRYHGHVVGEGLDHRWDDQSIRRTARRALSDLNSNPRIAHVKLDQRDELGREVTMELEVAGRLVPLVGDTFDAVGARIEPGLDGFAMRAGDQWVWRFPSQLRANNNSRSNPSFLMRGALSEFGLRKKTLAEHRTADGLSVYRFRTVHLAQRAANRSPFVTFRGSRLVNLADVQIDSLSAFANSLAEHIMQREWGRPERANENAVKILDLIDEQIREKRDDPDRQVKFDRLVVEENARRQKNPPVGLTGTYHPLEDVYRPLLASPLEQALASYALSRFARVEGVDGEVAGAAAIAALQILAELSEVITTDEFSEPDPLNNPAAAAMVVLATYELDQRAMGLRRVGELLIAAQDKCWAAFDFEQKTFIRIHGPDGSEREISPPDKALIASAIARLSLINPVSANAAEIARSALDVAWASVDELNYVTLLPWIGLGESEYAILGDAPAARARLDALRVRLEKSQITAFSSSRYDEQPADLAGGYVLSGSARSTATAQGVRPAVWLARRLTDRQKVPDDELARPLGRSIQFARFLMQLGVSEDDSWQYPGSERAIGGIRNALWDQTQELPAAALSLICISDMIQAVNRLDKNH